MSRLIGKYMKRDAITGMVGSVEVLERLTPNTFLVSKNGKLESTPFGSFSSIIFRLRTTNNGKFKTIEYAIHPDRADVLMQKIFTEKYRMFEGKSKNLPEFNLNGYVHDSSFYRKENPIEKYFYNAGFLNLSLHDEDNFLIKLSVGNALPIKDELNKRSFKDYKKISEISLYVPIEEMELLALKTIGYIQSYRNMIIGPMLEGRSTYEKRCNTIFKDVKGDPEKVKVVEEKFFKLAEDDRKLVLEGSKKL